MKEPFNRKEPSAAEPQPKKRSRNRIINRKGRKERKKSSEYLPPRREDAKVRTIIFRTWRLCALAGGLSEFETIRIREKLRKPHKL